MENFDNPAGKTKRAPNFREDEKAHLLSIIAEKYGCILEDKKTDRASVQNRHQAWKKIEENFNSSSPVIQYRSAECLKKFYDNSKKELRKQTAEQKQQIMKTGGGPPPDMILEPTQKLLYGIINSKTVNGLDGRADSDGQRNIINKYIDNEIEYIYENQDENDPITVENTFEHNMDENENITPEDDSIHLNVSNNTEVHQEANNVWSRYTPEDLRNTTDPALKVQTTKKGNSNTHRIPLNAARRRPMKTIQTLTSSQIAEKYNLLLDKRLCLVQKQIDQIDMDTSFKKHENKLKIELLELELKAKKFQILN